MDTTRKIGIYFHWPFCKSKCPYCDFYKEIAKNADQKEIIDSYIADLDFYRQFVEKQKVCSIFFGGGTPSLIEPLLIEKLINHIYKSFPMFSDIEISLEANPNTNKENLFSDLKSAGINRLSLGIQSFDDQELKFLGRTHNSKQALSAVEEITKTFTNHSIDLMYALPDQKPETWLKTLEFSSNFGLKHISLYQLTIEDGTVFQKKGISPLPEEQASELYLLTEDFLRKKNYYKYEVSNFSQKGFQSVHNLLYWQGDDYIGIGKSAHGRIGLLATEHPRQFYSLSPKERAEELIIMGLRLTEGIEKQKFFDICTIKLSDFINQNFLEEAKKEGLLIDSPSHLKATKQGFLVLNYLIEHLCP